MPYEIRRRDNQYCVIKTEDNQTMGCHDTREDAEAQRRAIHANESAIIDILSQCLCEDK